MVEAGPPYSWRARYLSQPPGRTSNFLVVPSGVELEVAVEVAVGDRAADAEPEGDVSFPEFDPSAWTEVSATPYPAGEGDEYPFVFKVLERR
mgnify:CR=1 FL=1